MKEQISNTLRPALVIVMIGLLAAFAGTLPARPDPRLAGVASVVDGDTLELHGTRIRLHGIDAPESSQGCVRPGGERWRCGQRSALALADRIGQATVRCEERDRDRYGRVVAVCFQAEKDLNHWLVSNGWAVAYRRYSTDYVEAEETARAANRGVWSGTFVMPWQWRRGERLTATPRNEAPGDCAIKGNISSSGERIYHVPGGRWYARTRINEDQGERWFCSEEKARAAGWRRAGQWRLASSLIPGAELPAIITGLPPVEFRRLVHRGYGSGEWYRCIGTSLSAATQVPPRDASSGCSAGVHAALMPRRHGRREKNPRDKTMEDGGNDAHVIGPDGEHMTPADLPAPGTRRWVARRKARVVTAVEGGLISRGEALKRYALSEEEYETWKVRFTRDGLKGLCVTKLKVRGGAAP